MPRTVVGIFMLFVNKHVFAAFMWRPHFRLSSSRDFSMCSRLACVSLTKTMSSAKRRWFKNSPFILIPTSCCGTHVTSTHFLPPACKHQTTARAERGAHTAVARAAIEDNIHPLKQTWNWPRRDGGAVVIYTRAHSVTQKLGSSYPRSDWLSHFGMILM